LSFINGQSQTGAGQSWSIDPNHYPHAIKPTDRIRAFENESDYRNVFLNPVSHILGAVSVKPLPMHFLNW